MRTVCCVNWQKPFWWSKPTATLNDTDLNYLMLYLEDQYTLTSEKKIQKERLHHD